MRKAIWTAAVGLVAVLPGMGALWGGATVYAAGEIVSIKDDDPDTKKWGFEPTALTVAAGTEVTWRHVGSQPHTVTADDKSFDSPVMNKGDEYKFTFANAGTYSYYCKPHPWMKGTVTVTGSAPAPTPTTAAPAPAQPAPAQPAPTETTAPAPPPPPKAAAQTAPAEQATTTTAPAEPTTVTTAAAPAPATEAPATPEAEAQAAETTAVEDTAEAPSTDAGEGTDTDAAAETEGLGEEHGDEAVALLSDDKETSGLAVGVAIGGTVILLATALLSLPGRKRPSPLT